MGFNSGFKGLNKRDYVSSLKGFFTGEPVLLFFSHTLCNVRRQA
jgi:hypothetical protein